MNTSEPKKWCVERLILAPGSFAPHHLHEWKIVTGECGKPYLFDKREEAETKVRQYGRGGNLRVALYRGKNH